MATKNKFFSSAPRTFTKVDHILDHKISLSKSKEFKSYKVHPLLTKKLNQKLIFTEQKENKVIL